MSILQTYGRSKHFVERAMERFNLTEEELDKFLADQGELLDTQLSPLPNRRNLLSEKGILFIVDDSNHVIVTCYSSIPPQVFAETQESFKERLNDLIWQAEVSEAQKVLSHLMPTLQKLAENAQTITDGELTEENYARLQESYEFASIIKYTFNMMGKHAKYYQEHRPKDMSVLSVAQEEDVRTPNNRPKRILRGPISNRDILQDKTPLRDILRPEDKQKINHWFMSQQRSGLASQAMSSIKSGATKTELLSRLKTQMSIIQLNQFSNELDRIIGGIK